MQDGGQAWQAWLAWMRMVCEVWRGMAVNELARYRLGPPLVAARAARAARGTGHKVSFAAGGVKRAAETHPRRIIIKVPHEQ